MDILFGNQDFTKEVKLLSGQSIDLCYQCQKCAAGCSMAKVTDFTPNQILRMIQIGLKEQVLSSSMIWLCSSCEICGTRCPNGIKMAEVMDVLKEMAINENTVKEKRIQAFNTIFLNTIRSRGRIHEILMMGSYKLKTYDFFSDVNLGLKMFVKGKLPLIGKKTKALGKLREIFKRSYDSGKKC